MPLYDLGCVECDHKQLDIAMSVAEYENATCPKCGGQAKSITFSKVITFRGGGWTPTLTGSFKQQTKEESLHEVTQEANRQELLVRKDLENERKEFFDYSPDPLQ